MQERSIGFTRDSVRDQFVILTVFWWTGFPAPVFAAGAREAQPLSGSAIDTDA